MKKNGWWKKDQMNILSSKIGNERHHPSSSKVKPRFMKQAQHCKLWLFTKC
jgi:hypothetical protein